jgi:hypothetical protein
MDRRLLLTALGCWPAGRLLAQEGQPRPRHKISAAQLHEALSARFPVRAGMRGLLEAEISAPSLHLRPTHNQLGAMLLAQVGGAQLRQAQSGELDVVFALRYEPADQTLRAHRLEILALRVAGLPQETAQTLQLVLPALAREAVGEFVLHRFTRRELGLADTMGFEPERIEVVEDGLVIWFGPKPRR